MNNKGINNPESKPKLNIQKVYSTIKHEYKYVKFKYRSYQKEKGISTVYCNKFTESEDGFKIKKHNC